MGFNPEAARKALKVFKGNIQLAVQTLVHYAGSLPPDLQAPLDSTALSDDSSSSSKGSPTDSAGKRAAFGGKST